MYFKNFKRHCIVLYRAAGGYGVWGWGAGPHADQTNITVKVSIVGCFSLYRMFNEKLRQKFSNIARALILPVMGRPILAPKNHIQEKGSKVINFFRKCAVLTPL